MLTNQPAKDGFAIISEEFKDVLEQPQPRDHEKYGDLSRRVMEVLQAGSAVDFKQMAPALSREIGPILAAFLETLHEEGQLVAFNNFNCVTYKLKLSLLSYLPATSKKLALKLLREVASEALKEGKAKSPSPSMCADFQAELLSGECFPLKKFLLSSIRDDDATRIASFAVACCFTDTTAGKSRSKGVSPDLQVEVLDWLLQSSTPVRLTEQAQAILLQGISQLPLRLGEKIFSRIEMFPPEMRKRLEASIPLWPATTSKCISSDVEPPTVKQGVPSSEPVEEALGLGDLIQITKKHLVEAEKEFDRLLTHHQKGKEELQKRLTTLNGQLFDKDEQIRKLELKISNKESRIDSLESSKSSLEEQLLKVRDILNDTVMGKNTLETEVKNITLELTDLNDKLKLESQRVEIESNFQQEAFKRKLSNLLSKENSDYRRLYEAAKGENSSALITLHTVFTKLMRAGIKLEGGEDA